MNKGEFLLQQLKRYEMSYEDFIAPVMNGHVEKKDIIIPNMMAQSSVQFWEVEQWLNGDAHRVAKLLRADKGRAQGMRWL